MLDNIKYFISLKTVDKCIKDANYDLALEKLNALIKEEFMPAETFLKRGRLCRKLLMYEEAYSDFTYIITHCAKKQDAYKERMLLNFEMSNFEQSISDANKILDSLDDKTEAQRIIFLSLVYLSKNTLATEYILNIFESNKYKAIHYILTEVAKNITEDNLSKALKLLAIIDIMDSDNPIKLFNEASIYGIAGDKEKEASLLKKLEFIFPKYFVSHFKFTDIYEDRDLMEIYFLLELKIFDKQESFSYPMTILEGYKNYMEGHIIDAKECFEKAIDINPDKPDAYVLLAETFQLMSGYDNPELKNAAEENYKIALNIYEKENLTIKAENMKRQIKHLNSSLTLR